MSKRDDSMFLYRRVFCRPEGTEVMADMLEELGFFNTTDERDEGAVALLNFARRLIIKCGLTFDTEQGRIAVVESLLGIEPVLEDPGPMEEKLEEG